MKKFIPVFLIIAFFLSGCAIPPGGEKTTIKDSVSGFVSPNHGSVSIFPSYKYLGNTKDSEGRGIRHYHVWENRRLNKYIIILQLVPKEGIFPEGLNWTSESGSLFVKGNRAAYDSLAQRLSNTMTLLGVQLPDCFILASEVYVIPEEALFRMLLVPDKICVGNYEPIMEELDRVAIFHPLK